MSKAEPFRGSMWQGEAPDPVVLRLVAPDGTVLQKADVSSISVSLYDLYDPLETVLWTDTLTVANVMFDTLQTDDYKFDSTGYNFRHQPTAANVAGCIAGRTYLFVYLVTPVTYPVQKHQGYLQVSAPGI